MHEQHAAQNESVRYQHDDVNVWPIVAFGGAMIGFAVVALGVTLLLYRSFAASEDARQTSLPDIVVKERLQLPADIRRLPPPVLQTNEPLDMDSLRKTEEARLHSYGWVDAKKGVVHMPIGEAMKRLIEREKARSAKGQTP